MLWLIDSCQNKASADQYHLTILGYELIEVVWVLKFSIGWRAQVRYYAAGGGGGGEWSKCKGKFRRKLTPGALFTFLPTYFLHNRILESP